MAERDFEHFAGRLEDFWERAENRPVSRREFRLYGRQVEVASNHAGVLDALEECIPLYSTAPPVDDAPYRLQFVVREALADPGPPPEHLPPHIRYTGSAGWIHLDLGGWGQVFTDLARGEARIILSPQLAARPDLVARSVLNTVLTNFAIHDRAGFLHATGLVHGSRVLLLMAPHNSGKSTTAMRLTLSGRYRLLSDSQIYVKQTTHGIRLTGFPVGRGKLRRDMLASFPDLAGRLTPEQVRDETKFVLDLRRLNPDLVEEKAVFPKAVDWCLLSRGQNPQTTLRPATEAEVWESILENSLFLEERAVWETNLGEIEGLVKMARFWRKKSVRLA